MNSFTLRSERIKDNCVQNIRDIEIVEGRYKRVTIADHVNSKTAQQRGWFHKLCAILGDEIGMQAGDIKEIAKAKLFGWRQVEYGGVTLTMADGHSERLSAKRYGELIDTVYLLAGESGIQLPPPDKYR